MKCVVTGLVLAAFLQSVVMGPCWAAGTTIILDDFSGSVGSGPRSPFEGNQKVVKKAILSMPKDSRLYVFGFGKGAPVSLLKVRTPKVAGPQGVNLKATREAAVRKFDENMLARREEIDASGTDIEGALYRAARIFSEAGEGARTLILASDMQQDAAGGRLTLRTVLGAPGQPKTVSAGSSPRSYPDLKDVRVHIYSAFSDIRGMSTGQVERAIQKLKAHWTEYFTNAGASIVEYRTNY